MIAVSVLYNHDEWLVWEQNACPMLMTLTLNPAMNELKDFIGSRWPLTILIFERRQVKWLNRWQGLKNLGQKMIDFLTYAANRVAFFTAYANSKKALLKKTQEIRDIADLGVMSDEDLINLFNEICRLYYVWYAYAWVCEPVEFRAQDILIKFLEEMASIGKLKVDIQEASRILLSPDEESFSMEISKDLLECSKALANVLKDKKISRAITRLRDEKGFPVKATEVIMSARQANGSAAIEDMIKKAKEHSEEYYWKKNNYFSTKHLKIRDIIEELFGVEDFSVDNPERFLDSQLLRFRKDRESTAEIKAKLLISLPPYYKGIAMLASAIGGTLKDRRKRTIMIANAAFDMLLGEVARRTKTEIEDCRYLIPQELEYFIKSPEEYFERFKERRKRFLVVQGDFPVVEELISDALSKRRDSARISYDEIAMNDPFIAEGDDADRYIRRLDSRLNFIKKLEVKEALVIQGVVAYRSPQAKQVSGVVRVIRDPKAEVIGAGEILVAPSTTPDYMDAIHRCKAIITDWGGQTSHAAITARELKKPCIIGTNYASHVLSNGQRVELDLEQGIIRRVEAGKA